MRLTKDVTFADAVMMGKRKSAGSEYSLKVVRKFQNRLLGARKFVFDADASRRLGEVIKEVPDLLVHNLEFIRAPHDQTWVEIEYMATLRAIGSHGPITDETATKLGFLWDKGEIRFATGAIEARNGEVELSNLVNPQRYRLFEPWEDKDQIAFAQGVHTSRMGIDTFLWGSTWNKLSNEDRKALRAHCRLDLDEKDPAVRQRLWSLIEEECRGELRIALAALLLLDRPSLVCTVAEHGPRHGLSRGKMITYAAHRVVTIALDPLPTLRREYGHNGVKQRRHEVRGHYCQSVTTRQAGVRGCVHQWVPTKEPQEGEQPRQWVCSKCGGKRWWRAACLRGDAAIGFVTHLYNVTGHRKGRKVEA